MAVYGDLLVSGALKEQLNEDLGKALEELDPDLSGPGAEILAVFVALVSENEDGA